MIDPIFDEPKRVSLEHSLKVLAQGKDWAIQQAPSTIWYFWIVGQAWIHGLAARGYSCGSLHGTMENNVGTLVVDHKAMRESAKRLVESELKGGSVIDRWISEWQSLSQSFNKAASTVRSTDLAKLSNEQLLDLFKQFCRTYYEEEVLPLSNEILIPYFDEVLGAYARSQPEHANTIAALAAPTKKSFLQIEEDELCQTKDFANHAEKWFFINAGYDGCHLLVGDGLKKRAKEICSNKRNDRQKSSVPASQSFGKEIDTILAMSRKVGDWKDERKRNNLIGSCIMDQFAAQIGRRTGLGYELTRHAIPRDIPKLIAGDKKIAGELEKRKLGVGWFVDGQHETDYFTGEDYKQFSATVQTVKKPAESLQGVSASPGVVQGVARIVYHPDQEVFNAGEILVTSMTRPEFVPLMRKAAAVLCDEGGLLSHAAIVSRELGIPCIVGLRNAMASLKSGDKIEVNADKGVVRKL